MKTISLFSEKKKDGEKISMITCYDYVTSKLISKSNIDAILVGDSLGMVIQGNNDTLSVTVEDMIYHTKAVKKGSPDAFIVTDMPFLSYHISPEDSVKNAGKIIKESSASAVKVEGGLEIIDSIKALINAKIPVMGHLGLTPQSLNIFGGFKVQGKSYENAKSIINDAIALQEAGVFSIVLECIPEKLAALITNILHIPTIGIGSGNNTDGQVLVIYDALGMFLDIRPKFVKNFSEAGNSIVSGINSYVDQVTDKSFPDKSHTFSINDEIIEQLKSEFIK